MCFIDSDCVITVIKSTAKDSVSNHRHTKGLWIIGSSIHREPYCLRHAVIPGFRVTNCQDNLCIRVVVTHLAPKMRRWPIDRGKIAGICRIPGRELSLAGGAPQRFLLGIGVDICHVMTRPEPKMLQRELQRICASATHACTNDI
ncbi:hypothetical protein X772_36780 [Mesorhizobium sp. LSJC280B00]|nr:hypothetical protein X772_36780 [Mesorhizobium sp. LSJC280B00]